MSKRIIRYTLAGNGNVVVTYADGTTRVWKKGQPGYRQAKQRAGKK